MSRIRAGQMATSETGDICWLNPFTGIAGDMLLASLIDAGAPVDGIRSVIASSGLSGWELAAERIVTHGITATRVTVTVTDTASERSAADLLRLAARVRPEPVAEIAVAALRAIAEAEGRLHGEDPAQVHLHELGGHDTIVDVVGTAAALHLLDITQVYCAPLPLASAQIRTRHGLLPAPAPATLALLEGARITGSDLAGETVTPTGAALLKAIGTQYESLPAMTIGATGYGAGHRTLPDRPNIVAATIGHIAEDPTALVVLETNLDDVTGELLGHVIGRVLAAGALDAWATPAVMKKGRPAYVLHVLARPEASASLKDLILAETGSLGVRQASVTRLALPRHTSVVTVRGHAIRIKHGPHSAKPEHDDVAAAAAALGRPLREVAAEALRLAGEAQHRVGDQP